MREKVLGVLPMFHIYDLALNYALPLTIGAQMVLVLAPKPKLYQADGLKAFAREHLTRYKVPRDFYHFDQLARDQTGKIRRREVRDTLLKILTQP